MLAPTSAIDRALSDLTLRELLSDCVGRRSASVARALTEKLNRPVTQSMLNSFTRRDSERARFPAAWVAAFCEVTRDDRLARFVMGPRLAALVQLGEALLELGEIDPKARRLAARLKRAGRRRKKGRGRR